MLHSRDAGSIVDFRTATADARRRDTVLLVAIIAIGAALRMLHLGAPSFWLDEALSVDFARLPWPRFVQLMQTRELNMLPYYLLLRAWIHLGTAEWIVRSLSVICSITTLPILYRLGVRLFGVRVGQIGVTLLALHPYHIRFAQEARGYSLMVLLVTASTLLLVRATEFSSAIRARLGSVRRDERTRCLHPLLRGPRDPGAMGIARRRPTARPSMAIRCTRRRRHRNPPCSTRSLRAAGARGSRSLDRAPHRTECRASRLLTPGRREACRRPPAGLCCLRRRVDRVRCGGAYGVATLSTRAKCVAPRAGHRQERPSPSSSCSRPRSSNRSSSTST